MIKVVAKVLALVFLTSLQTPGCVFRDLVASGTRESYSKQSQQFFVHCGGNTKRLLSFWLKTWFGSPKLKEYYASVCRSSRKSVFWYISLRERERERERKGDSSVWPCLYRVTFNSSRDAQQPLQPTDTYELQRLQRICLPGKKCLFFCSQQVIVKHQPSKVRSSDFTSLNLNLQVSCSFSLCIIPWLWWQNCSKRGFGSN